MVKEKEKKKEGGSLGRPRNEEEVERLQAAAFELFSLKGVEATSYSDIAKQAYVTKSHIQHYFPKKDKLISNFVYKSMDSVMAIAAELPQFDTCNALTRLIIVDYIQLYYAMNSEKMIRMSMDILLDRATTQTVIDAGIEYNLIYLLNDASQDNIVEFEDAIRFLYGGIYDRLYDCLSKRKPFEIKPFIIYGIRILEPYVKEPVPESLVDDLEQMNPWLDEQKSKYNRMLFGL